MMLDFFGFILFVLLLFLGIRRKRERWKQFTAQEKGVIRRQTGAMTVPILSLALAILTDINGQLLFLLSVPFLLYVGMSAIVNQISIVRPKGTPIASKGPAAVLSGLIILAGTIWGIYFLFTQALTLRP